MSLHEINAHTGTVNEKLPGIVGNFSEADGLVREAQAKLALIAEANKDSELSNAAAGLAEASLHIGQLASMVAQVPEVLNPYLRGIGANELGSITVPPPADIPQENPNDYKLDEEGEPDNSDDSEEEDSQELQDQIDDLIDRIKNGEDPNSMGELVGEGGGCFVFNGPNGTVIKIPKNICTSPENSADDDDEYFDDDAQDMHDRIEALTRGQGIEGAEQLAGTVTIQTENGPIDVPLCGKINGQTVDDMSPVELEEIPQEHYDQVINTIDTLMSNGLVIDNDPANVMYDPDKGFVVIDYDTREHREAAEGGAYTNTNVEVAQEAVIDGALVSRGVGKWPSHQQKVKMDEAIRKKYGDAAANKASTMRQEREEEKRL